MTNWTTQIVTKLKNTNFDKTPNSNCDKNQKHKLLQKSKTCLWQNSKTPIVTKLKKTQIVIKIKNPNCDTVMTVVIVVTLVTVVTVFCLKVVTKLKNTNCYKTMKLKFWQNYQKKLVAKCKIQVLNKLKKKNNCEKSHKLKLWQISKTQIVTKLKKNQIVTNSKTQIVTVVIWTVVTGKVGTEVIMTSFSKNNLSPGPPMRCSRGSFLQFFWCFLFMSAQVFVSALNLPKNTLNSNCHSTAYRRATKVSKVTY